MKTKFVTIFSIIQFCLFYLTSKQRICVLIVGVGRIFSGGEGTWGFFQNFSRRGPNVAKFVFSHSKLRKQPFLLKISKSRPPSDAHGLDHNLELFVVELRYSRDKVQYKSECFRSHIFVFVFW